MRDVAGSAVKPRYGESAGEMVAANDTQRDQRKQDLDLLQKQLGETIMDLISDPDNGVSDVYVNPDGELWEIRRGVTKRVGLRVAPEYVTSIIWLAANLGGQVANRREAIVDVALPWGQRFHGELDYVVNGGPTFAIRVHSRESFTLQSYLDTGRCAPEVMEVIEWALRDRLNIVVCGVTGSGKTAFLDALFGHPTVRRERIISVEDTAELKLDQVPNKKRNVVDPRRPASEHGEAMGELVAAAMRSVPDRIVIGEARHGRAVRGWVQGLYSGHGGGMLTMHADDPSDCMERLEMMLAEVIADTRPWRPRLIKVAQRIIWVRRDPRGGGRVEGVYRPTFYDDRNQKFMVERMAGLPLEEGLC